MMPLSSQFQPARGQPEIPAPKFRHFARSSQTCSFLKKRLSEKYKSSVREIPDLGYADFQRARATTPPVRNRLGMPTAHHNHERALLRDELVSVHRPRKLRHRRRETSSLRRSARSRLWRTVGILRRFLTGGVVARALWKSAHPTSGISCTENVFETQFFTTIFFNDLWPRQPERRRNLPRFHVRTKNFI